MAYLRGRCRADVYITSCSDHGADFQSHSLPGFHFGMHVDIAAVRTAGPCEKLIGPRKYCVLKDSKVELREQCATTANPHFRAARWGGFTRPEAGRTAVGRIGPPAPTGDQQGPPT